MQEHKGTHEELKALGSALAGWSRTMPYAVPEGYFGKLEIHIGEQGMLPADKSQLYDVPEGYFELLPDQVLRAVTRTEKKKNIRFAVRWSAAASILLCIGLSGYMYFHKPAIEQQLARLNRDGLIEAYVQEHIDEFDSEMIEQAFARNMGEITPEKLEEKDIIEYLNENGWQ